MKNIALFLLFIATSFKIISQQYIEVNKGLINLKWGELEWTDYDQDGDLDIAITGINDNKTYTKIYKNVNNEFIEVNTAIEGFHYGASIDWGDYDSDNDLDLLISGLSDSGPLSKIYRNDSGQFKDIEAKLISVRDGIAMWGDYDNDNDLDILIGGLFELTDTNKLKIYKNEGNSFEETCIDLIGVSSHKFAGWGDYDNDGDLDIFVAGSVFGNYVDSMYAFIYKNNNGEFSKVNTNIINTAYGGCSRWGDYDNDGDIDLAIMGTDFDWCSITKIYRNDNNVFTDIEADLYYLHKGNVNWGDIDNDEDLDLLLSGLDDNDKAFTKIYVNSQGKFKETSIVLTGFAYASSDFGDYDNDGDMDLIICGELSNYNAKTIFYENRNDGMYFSPEICLVTVDPLYNKNLIVWEKKVSNAIHHYNIYKETTTVEIYELVGSLLYESISIYLDTTSNPSQRADRYKISTIDTSGEELFTSDYHQTMHLLINKGLPGTYNLMWTPYIGFDYGTYYIYKGKSPDKLEIVDSISSTYNQYTDNETGKAYYQIAVEKENPCFPTEFKKSESGPYSRSVSNIEDNLELDGVNIFMNDNFIKIYPIPAENVLNIEFQSLVAENVKIELINLLGQVLFEEQYLNIEQNQIFKINLSNLHSSEKMLILKLTIDNENYFRKVVLK